MSTRDRTPANPDCVGDAAAYVLGALDDHEAEAFRRHMAGCVVCRDEVASLQPVADALPLAAPQYPVSRGLRRRVLTEVRADARKRQALERRRLAWPRLTVSRPLAGLAAAAVIALAVVGVVELASGGSGAVRVIRAQVTASAARAELRLAGGQAELIVHRMPPAGAGHIYEVWLKRPSGPPAPTTALFGVTATGSGRVSVPGNLHGVSEVLVTPEPDGGSPAPTHAPVIVARLT